MSKPLSILITGSKGMLGSDLMDQWSDKYCLSGIDLPEVDVCDAGRIVSYIETAKPDIVVHTAAFTDVDACELREEYAVLVNCEGTRNVALGCKAVGAKMIHISTDYVFDGLKKTPYEEEDKRNPMTVYGRTKLTAERLVAEILEDYAIVRTGWLYGPKGKSFVSQIVRQAIRHTKGGEPIEPIKVVEDQLGNPTSTAELIRQLDVVVSERLSGLYHCTCGGEASWYQFAWAIVEKLPLSAVIEPCDSTELDRPAKRPINASLENKRLNQQNHNVMRDWRSAFDDFAKAHGKRLLTEHGAN